MVWGEVMAFSDTNKKDSRMLAYYSKKLVSLQCSIKKQSDMRKRDTIKMEVTPEEEELIKAIRNYCASYPNGYPELLDYAEDIFQRMTDMPKE